MIQIPTSCSRKWLNCSVSDLYGNREKKLFRNDPSFLVKAPEERCTVAVGSAPRVWKQEDRKWLDSNWGPCWGFEKKHEKLCRFCKLCLIILIRCASQGLATAMLDHHERGGTAAGSLAEAERSLWSCERSLPDRRWAQHRPWRVLVQ